MTNARCLTEGVDVPVIDCVLFADPKQSRIDIVQAAGRALRTYPGKQYGYIVVPLVVPGGMDFDEFAETTAFRQVAQTITALSTQDERIAEEFRLIETGRVSRGKIVEIDGDVPVGMKMKLSDFAEAISTRVWESVGRANWRPYDQAVKFVHPLELKSGAEWLAYCKGGRKDLPKKPPDIPLYPDQTYGEEFRMKGGWGGWLGTGTVATHLRKYRPYDEAVKFVHPLKLRNHNPEWLAYCRGERKELPPKPDDIPFNAARTYGEEFRKKGGWGGWLGTDTIATNRRRYRSYDEAVKFVRPLKLKNHDPEWLAYCRGERKDLPPRPNDIPVSPSVVYGEEFSEKGGWGAWLGTGRVANKLRRFRSYDEGVKFVHPLKLTNQREWNAYRRGERKDLPPRPRDIPTNPYSHYGEEFRQKGGWRGWLGTKGVSSHQRLEASVRGPAELQIDIPD